VVDVSLNDVDVLDEILPYELPQLELVALVR
jgi:hypothetical protein